MWNISERAISGSFYTRLKVNNWNFGKERAQKKTPWGGWKVLADTPRLFVAMSPVDDSWFLQGYHDGFWIAWRD